MNTFDGRGLAVGIAGGVVIGLIIMFITGNSIWIAVLAAIGAVIGMNAGFGNKGDS